MRLLVHQLLCRSIYARRNHIDAGGVVARHTLHVDSGPVNEMADSVMARRVCRYIASGLVDEVVCAVMRRNVCRHMASGMVHEMLRAGGQIRK